MRTFRATRFLPISPDAAWRGLADMAQWLVSLDTITSIEYSGEFFRQGTQYKVHTREGVTMSAELIRVDRSRRIVEIRATSGPLTSLLRCAIEEVDGGVKLIREQSYPGLAGAIFSRIYARREGAETVAYLDAWARAAAEHAEA